MKQNRLRTAVVLGLLLSNTWGVVEAVEYTTTITGKETGYESIRTEDAVSGEISYDFSGENKIKTDVANFRPIDLDNTKVTINIGDQLTLIGKDPTQQIKDGIILTNSANDALTFNGNELSIQDISTGYRSPQLVTATDGGSITFNNKHTEIGTYNQQNGSLGINVVETGSSIVFTENVDRLDLNTVRGINVENGGNFEFNNTNGIVHIQSSGGSSITLRGGNLTIKGKETIIRSVTDDGLTGNWAIGVDSNTTASTLNFEADHTAIQGRQAGIDIYNSLSDTMINFKGTAHIKSLNNAGVDGAKAMASYRGKSIITFEKHVVLEAECGATGVAFGAQIENASVLNALDGMDVYAKSVTGKAFGLGVYGDNSLIDITGNTALDVSSTDGMAVGIQGWTNGTVEIKGLTKITTNSDKNIAIGLWAKNSGLISLDDIIVDTTAKDPSDVTSAILSHDSGAVNVNGSALLNVKTDVSNLKGIFAYAQGQVTIAKDAEINVETGYHYARGITAENSGDIKIGGDALVQVNSEYSSIGLDVYDPDSIVTIDGSAALKVTGGNDASGINISKTGQVIIGADLVAEVSSSDLSAKGIKLDEAKTTVNGAAFITANSVNGAVSGIDTWHLCTIDAAALKIKVATTGSNNTSDYGINNQWDSTITVKGDTDIAVNTVGHAATGIRNYWNSTVAIDGSASIVATNSGNNHFAYGIDATADGSGVNTAITINKDAYIEASGMEATGINTVKNTVNIGGNAVIKSTSKGSTVHGILSKDTSQISIGGDAYISASSDNRGGNGVRLETGSSMSVGKKLVIAAQSDNADSTGLFIWTNDANKLANVEVTETAAVSAQGKDKSAGICAFADQGTATFKTLQGASVQAVSQQGAAYGILTDKNGIMEIGGSSIIEAVSDGKNAIAVIAQNGGRITLNDISAKAISNAGGDANNTTDGILVKSNSYIKVNGNAVIVAAGQESGTDGIYVDQSELNIDGALAVSSFSGAGSANGIYGYESKINVLGDVYVESKSINGQAVGIRGEMNSNLDFASKVDIKIGSTEQLQSSKAASQQFGVVSKDSSNINFADDVRIDMSEIVAGNTAYGVYTSSKGKVEFQKGLIVDATGAGDILRASGADSSITVNSNGGGNVYLAGSITADDTASISVNLDSNNTYFSGSTHETNNGTVNMQLHQGALWRVAADSKLTSLALNSNSMVDLASQAGAQNLTINNLSGNNAVISLGVNLRDGLSDKVYINGSTTTSGTHLLKIYDEKYNVGANLHLLLVDDASGQYNFAATDAYGGGIFTYKASISSEDGVGTQWYLEKLTRGDATTDAYTLAHSNDTIYSDWINNSDNLHNRLNALQDSAVEKGLWVDIHGGKLKGDNFSNNYQTYQIGYDAPFKSTNNKSDSVWVGGLALEYGKGSVGYTSGSGEHSSGAVSLYASKHTANNENISFIIKNGYLRGNLKTHGIGSDTGDYKTQAISMSAEYSKRFVNKYGAYVEPRLQFIFGHINEHKITTGKNNIAVQYDGINTAIGRLGVTVGKKMKTSEMYAKLAVAHEFGGAGAVTLAASNEQLRIDRQYSGTWLELGIGGKYIINKTSSAYLEAERSFGGSFQRQWAINAGINVSF